MTLLLSHPIITSCVVIMAVRFLQYIREWIESSIVSNCLLNWYIKKMRLLWKFECTFILQTQMGKALAYVYCIAEKISHYQCSLTFGFFFFLFVHFIQNLQNLGSSTRLNSLLYFSLPLFLYSSLSLFPLFASTITKVKRIRSRFDCTT